MAAGVVRGWEAPSDGIESGGTLDEWFVVDDLGVSEDIRSSDGGEADDRGCAVSWEQPYVNGEVIERAVSCRCNAVGGLPRLSFRCTLFAAVGDRVCCVQVRGGAADRADSVERRWMIARRSRRGAEWCGELLDWGAQFCQACCDGDTVVGGGRAQRAVLVPGTAREIEDEAFVGLPQLHYVFCGGRALRLVEAGAFKGCGVLRVVKLPECVREIGGDGENGAFSGCVSLVMLALPRDLVTIGESAFSGCAGLAAVCFPPVLARMERLAFCGCVGLTSLLLPASLRHVGRSAFGDCRGVRSVRFAGTAATIEEYAFQWCTALEVVVLPRMLSEVSAGVFEGCRSMRELRLPTTVARIGDCAFWECRQLGSISLPEAVEWIGEWAFHGCSALTSVCFPRRIRHIDLWAFEGCARLKGVSIPQATTLAKGAFPLWCRVSRR